MPRDIDAIEYMSPYEKDLPASRPSLVAAYDSPSPEFSDDANHKVEDVKPPQPPPPKMPTATIPDPLQKLLDLPILRPIPWKEGQDLPPERSSAHERIQVRGAVIMTTRGDVADKPCDRCARGVGRFAKCISKEGWFMGACATCQMSSKGNLCSFRTEKEDAARRKTLANAASAQARTSSPPGHTLHLNGSLMKRKRVSTDKADLYKKPRPASCEEGFSYEKSFDDDSNALLQYVYNQQHVNLNGGVKRHHQQFLTERNEPRQDARASKSNGHDFQRDSPYGGRERSSFNEGNMAGGFNDAPPQIDEPLALIDTFPRKKQKQLFAIIGSLQSGIRTSRQQTENLQGQLDTLQTILGMDPDDADYT